MHSALLRHRPDDDPFGLMSPTAHLTPPDHDTTRLVSRVTAVPLACAACLGATAMYVAIDDPGDGDGGLAPCPYRAATGWWCPGCGLTRATHHLARGKVFDALALNMFVPLLLTAIVVGWWTWFQVARGQGAPRWVDRLPRSTYIAAGLALVAFGVLRNLPGADVLRGG